MKVENEYKKLIPERFRKEYGQMVIACDSSNVWRTIMSSLVKRNYK